MNIVVSILIFLGVLFVVISIHELGHFFAFRIARVAVKELGLGFPPRLFAIKRGETEYSINAVPLGAFVMPVGDESPVSPGSLANKSPWVRIWASLAGPLANGLLAFVLFVAYFMMPVQVVVGGEGGAEILQVAPGSPAEAEGIQPGDIFLRIDGEEVTTTEQMHQIITAASASSSSLAVDLMRGEEGMQVVLTPLSNPPEGELPLGIGYRWLGPYILQAYRTSFTEASYLGGQVIVNIPALLLDALSSGEAQLVGPVGAGQMVVEAIGYDFSGVIFLAGLISIGIGLFNLVPIPPLDGGGIVVALIEGIRRGKRLSPQGMRLAYAIGTALLITVFITITLNDILRLVRGESLMP